ncbi:septal ring lytic transglycosylase RlpA family protein [Ignatzschineria rhizosphaerae]|nr:septal ring lytic transglycosylase RlpA family protein [Ignatzschineria rhizosphaerae]
MGFSTTKKLLICTLAIFVIASCAGSKKPKAHNGRGATPQDLPLSKSGNPSSYVVFGKTYTLLPTTKGYKEKGMASWYGDKFHGKPTSSGTPYDMHAYTAAHKTLPIPSFVTVTNTDTNKSITVMVNDRGPFVKGRIIDLSYAAAKELDVVQKGTAPVIVEAIGPHQYLDPNKKPRNNPRTEAKSAITAAKASASDNVTIVEQQYFDQAPPSQEFINSSYTNQTQSLAGNSNLASGYHIQLGSFGSEQNALNFQQNMTNRLQQPTQVKYDKGLYRVYVGHYNSREEAGNAAFSLPVSTTIIHF